MCIRDSNKGDKLNNLIFMTQGLDTEEKNEIFEKEYRKAIGVHHRFTADDKETDMLPEEKISTAVKEHIENIRQQVFEHIYNNSPSFFEHLVMDLLLKMGYGYDNNSGVVTGRSHDGGIDGIINEDKLGLDIIYIQAKRYNDSNSVGRKEVQAFVGAMENVQKGVFITTSKFTKEAVEFVERQRKISN